MNTQKIRNILRFHKENFKKIHKEEIYKWEAVKWFRDNWDPDADDFTEMMERSLSKTSNLLDSGNYFPKRMILRYSNINPQLIRQLFLDLYNEESDLKERIENFQSEIKAFNLDHFPDKQSFQDHRAIIVYLNLQYPDQYYLYKFGLLKKFCLLIDYPYIPKNGEFENITQYLVLCGLLREEVIKDNELLQLHKTRLTENYYSDPNYHILTQDVIYAAVNYFKQSDKTEPTISAFDKLVKVNISLEPKSMTVNLKGSFTNHIERAKRNKRIGDLGELLVMQYETEKLKVLGIKKAPEHKSKSEGDGIGYDILSYDETGKGIFIEVKTTTDHQKTPFFITQNELEKSKQEGDRFYLYRLYDYDIDSNSAKYFIEAGDLSHLCITPTTYQVNP